VLTFVSSIYLWLANECRRVNPIASQEHVVRVCNTATYITSNIVVTTAVVTILAKASTSVSNTEKTAELLAKIKDRNLVRILPF